MNLNKRYIYIEALKKQKSSATGLDRESINYKIEKLSENTSSDYFSTSSLISRKFMEELIQIESLILSGIYKLKAESKDSDELIDTNINIIKLKILFMKKELKNEFTGSIEKLEKINGEIDLSILKTEFDPISEIRYISIYLNNVNENICIDLTNSSNSYQLSLNNTSKLEMILFDAKKKVVFGIAIIPSTFFINKIDQKIKIAFDIFHSITFGITFKKRMNLNRFDDKNQFIIQYGHILEKIYLNFPVYCVVCEEMCMMFNYIYKCINCNVKIHQSCACNLIFNCLKSFSSKFKNNYNIKHTFDIKTSSGMNYCNHCGERIEIVEKMVFCKTCLNNYHEKCKDLTFDSCGIDLDLIKKISELRLIKILPKAEKTEVNISNFELVRVLGRGAFGKVFLAKKLKNGEEIALKVIKKESIKSQSELSYINAERMALEKISKSKTNFVIQLNCYFEDKKYFYFGLTYSPCGDLLFHLKKRDFSEEEIKLYTAELIIGLETIHKNNIAYRDLKLDNILLMKEGHISICDFGLCKMNMETDTSTYTNCGTLNTMAPEVIKGNGYDKTVDFWSLGVTIYEMFHKEHPFFGVTTRELINSIINNKVIFKTKMSENAKSFINMLLTKDPKQRLGYGKDGLYKIKTHKWFHTINWEDVEELKVRHTYIPKIGNDNVDDEINAMKPQISYAKSVLDFKEIFQK